ncbi:MAG: hypothetical protein Q8928_17315 [Bacteroidota bacterium]|nr:hypothetical protein [Bacteroidota bacterium]
MAFLLKQGSPEISKNNWAGGVDFEKGTSETRNCQLTSFEFTPARRSLAKRNFVVLNGSLLTAPTPL